MAQTATNPDTGERFELVAGQWVPLKTKSAAAIAQDKADAEERARPLASSSVEAALVSTGDVFNTIGLNMRKLRAQMSGTPEQLAQIEAERADAAKVRERLHTEAPKAALVGQLLPSLATAPLGGGSLAGQLISGGLQSGITSQSGDMATDAALGVGMGAAGIGAANIGQRIWRGSAAALPGSVGMVDRQIGELGAQISNRVRGVRGAIADAREAARAEAASQLTEGEKAIIAGADRAGLIVTPGARAGSNTMRQFEAGLASNPFTSDALQAIEQANKETVNRLAARAIGVEADNVGPVVRAEAEAVIGNDFKKVGDALGVIDTKKLHKDLVQAANEEATSALPTSEAWRVLKRFEKGKEARGEAVAGAGPDLIHGSDLIAMRSQVSKEMRDAFSNKQSQKGQVLASVLERVDDAIARAARATGDEGLVDIYSAARDRWNVLRALDRGGATPEGNVLIHKTAANVGAGDKGGYHGLADVAGNTTQRTGSGRLGDDAIGDFYDALRFKSSQIGKPIVGDSGTATRSAVGQLFMGDNLLANVTKAGARLAAAPLTVKYANLGNEGAEVIQRTLAALRGVPLSQSTAAGAAGLAGQAAARAAPIVGGQP